MLLGAVARTLPLWARQFNLNNWMSKMYQWSVFSVSPASTYGDCGGNPE
jgi:hypothetical protein